MFDYLKDDFTCARRYNYKFEEYIFSIIEAQRRNRIILLHNALVKSCPVGLHLSSLRDTNDMVDKQDFKNIAEFGLKFCKFCPSSHLHECSLKPFLVEYINLVEGN